MSLVLGRKEFLPFKERMIKNGWESVNKKKIVEVLSQLEVVGPPHPETGMEEGFTKFISGKGARVTVWTKYVEETGQTREGWDPAHIVIVISNTVVYLAPDIKISPTFFERLFFEARLVEARVRIRPVCIYCGRLMDIAWTKHHQHWWFCRGSQFDKDHPKYTVKWDEGMPDEFMPHLKKRRRNTYRYNLKRDILGKPHKHQGRKRKIWQKKKQPPH